MKKERKYIVYRHTSPNGKVYIGITCTSAKIRWGVSGKRYNKNILFYRAINKYGWDKFKHEILLENQTKSCAIYAEKYLIRWYKSHNISYNITDGGEGSLGFSHKLSAESKEKLRQINLGHKFSKESREKMSKSHLGHKESEETKRKKSLKMTGKRHTAETKAKISKIQSGRPKSKETKNKLRTILRENSPFKKPILQYNLNNEFVAEYSSASEAARVLNLDSSGIRKAARGVYGHNKYKTYIWKEK